MTLLDQFLNLAPDQKRSIQLQLCQHALGRWSAYADAQGEIIYIDSVVGLQHRVDPLLPGDALESVRAGLDLANVIYRYMEPITALQDDDLEFPKSVEFAYYSIYNLFRKYIEAEKIDDWLIVNQALSSEEDPEQWRELLDKAIQSVT